MNETIVRVTSVIVGAMLATALAVPASATPQGDDAPTPSVEGSAAAASTSPYFDITKLAPRNVNVTSSGCQYVTVTAAVKARSGTDDWWASTDITRGKSLVSSVFFSDTDGRQDRFLYCPSDGYGKFTVGPTEWSSWILVGDSWNYYSGIDTTKGYFYARTKTKASISSATRSGGYTSVKVSASRYDPANYPEWTKLTVPKIVLQVYINGGWKSVSAGALKNGVATLRYKTNKAQTYRVWIPQTDSTLSAISGSLKK